MNTAEIYPPIRILLTRDVPVLPRVGPEEVDVAPPVPLAGDGVVVAVVRPDGVQHRHQVPGAAAVAEALLVLKGHSVALSMAILATRSASLYLYSTR